ncbi:hypothetical protein GJA_3253 [Janthinobacterium agaricidamnosum NBRC 102515 = DSM 9628]|uniref:Uncharacterized protein n=1 Tax=Janthinobacterium agaricidamnosum NBRC 102515 = DSM 9628 TaxID=1349767 RepID=W0V951_9BURK|nr:hypothetical protein GJA_3253 [Janthinobacterium agaricidamnosum NBRC 102515 = DSM 9628]
MAGPQSHCKRWNIIVTKNKIDALYVKFKANSPITVNRDTVNAMAQHFAQDTTFVTHLALARLRDDIAAGRLDMAHALPLAGAEWSPPANPVRERGGHPLKSAELAWQEDIQQLADAFNKM